MSNDNISVPRDPNLENKNVTKDIEQYLIDLFSKNEDEPFHNKELLVKIRRKFAAKYGWGLDVHLAWALDALHFNQLIKRVAPGTFEAISGPDDVYSERETGHAPEGEFSKRGYNVYVKQGYGDSESSKQAFNAEMRKVEISVKMLKNLGWSAQQIQDELNKFPDKFKPVLIKLAIKRIFKGISYE
jgi:hypothetical protein